MIIYKIGDIECKLDWDTFLVLETSDDKFYKSDFADFAELYEFIDRKLNIIKLLKFENSEYHLEQGILHDLWGPAKITYVDGGFGDGFSRRFFINGRIVYTNKINNQCRNMKDFEESEIFFFEEITGKVSGTQEDGTFYRRKEGVDYINHYIDLKKLREKDIRKQKLIKLDE